MRVGGVISNPSSRPRIRALVDKKYNKPRPKRKKKKRQKPKIHAGQGKRVDKKGAEVNNNLMVKYIRQERG